MSTTDFTFDNDAIVKGGLFQVPFSNAGITITQKLGDNSEMRVIITGTEAKLRIFADGSTHSWTVDGGSTQTDSTGGDVNAFITLFTGLSDAAHTVIIHPGHYIGYSPICLEVTGSSPAIAAPSGYTNNVLGCASAGFVSDGVTVADNSEGYYNVLGTGTLSNSGGVPCRFKATTTAIRLWCRCDTTDKIGLVVDGDLDGMQVATISNTVFGYGVEFTGLDGGAEHEYRVLLGGHSVLANVMFENGTFNTTPLTHLPIDYWYGDSITLGSGTTWQGANFPARYGILAGRGWTTDGHAGLTGAGYGVTHKADPGDFTPTADAVWEMWGMNDQAGGSGVSAGDFQTAVASMDTQFRSDLPSAKIYSVGIIVATASATNGPTFNAAKEAAVTGLADPDTIYIETSSWTDITTGDGTHPNDSGAAIFAQHLYDATVAPAVATGATATMGSPTSGYGATTLGAITLAADPGGTFTDETTYTLTTDLGTFDTTGLTTADVVFAADGDTPDATPKVILPASSASGTGHVTFANDKSLANPGTLTFTRTAFTATPTATAGSTTITLAAGRSGGTSTFTYAWTVASKPVGATDPTFDNAASATPTATVTKAGAYTFTVIITDANGLTATGTTGTATVTQTHTTTTISPSSPRVVVDHTRQFTATGLDQFAATMVSQPTFTWSTPTGTGTVDSAGLYTAPSAAESGSVRATANGHAATATVTVREAGTNKPLPGLGLRLGLGL
jgi:lysophospholipase L1-like esterase